MMLDYTDHCCHLCQSSWTNSEVGILCEFEYFPTIGKLLNALALQKLICKRIESSTRCYLAALISQNIPCKSQFPFHNILPLDFFKIHFYAQEIRFKSRFIKIPNILVA